MQTAIDLKYAMRVAAGEIWPDTPMDEAVVLNTLFYQRFAAQTKDAKVDGYTHWQIRDAMEDILRMQGHTPYFREHVEQIGVKLSGRDEPRAGESLLMSYLAHWKDLTPRQHLDACTQFVDYMNDLFKQDFGLKDSFNIKTKIVNMAPWEDNYDTGETEFKVIRTHPVASRGDTQNYSIHVNASPSAGFGKPVPVMRDIFAAGIKALNLHVGREYLEDGGAHTPVTIFEDAERMAGFQRYQIYKFAATFDDDVVFTERIAQEQAKIMAGHLAATMQRCKDVPPPPPLSQPTLAQRVGCVLGFQF